MGIAYGAGITPAEESEEPIRIPALVHVFTADGARRRYIPALYIATEAGPTGTGLARMERWVTDGTGG